MNTKLEEYWERRRLAEERKAARRKAMKGTAPLAKSKAEKASGKSCRVCLLHGVINMQGIEAHHIVHRSRIGSRHPMVHEPDNIMPVCHRHHQDHHSTHHKIPRSALTDEERAFLLRYGGEGWTAKWYPI